MKKNPQGKHWHRLDNTGKIFPMIANENLSNVFRISATLKEKVEPQILQQALEEVLPEFEGFQVKLKRGFFWYYFEHNKRTPYIEKESDYPCRYIDPKSNQLFLFRVSYYENRINFEVFHAITDGMGAVTFLKALVYRYLQIKNKDSEKRRDQRPDPASQIEDSYLKNYKKVPKRSYSSRRAFHLTGEYLTQGAENITHGAAGLKELKEVCKAKGVSVTKYLTACLIWAIYEEYLDKKPSKEPIGVSLPVNLRAFFGSKTISNFFAVIGIDYEPKEKQGSFDSILQTVSHQMDEKIVKERLEETISYNVSNEKKWYVRILPLFVKWVALGIIFRRNDRAHTITLSNIGPIVVEEAYRDQIETFHMIIGVSRRQNAKCGICAYGDHVMITFATVFKDDRLQKRFFEKLREDGIPVDIENNGVTDRTWDKGMYPQIAYDPDKWKKLMSLFYAVLMTAAVVVGIVNWLTFSGLWWAGIAIPAILFAALTFRYSIFKHANLGKSVMIETLGLQILLFLTDVVLGYQGWSVNYAIPSILLFADIVIVFLIIVNRLNWQSYFMYQIAITCLSFLPVILWAMGLITNPAMTWITVVLSVLILLLTILFGDKRVKNELIRRFHL